MVFFGDSMEPPPPRYALTEVLGTCVSVSVNNNDTGINCSKGYKAKLFAAMVYGKIKIHSISAEICSQITDTRVFM